MVMYREANNLKEVTRSGRPLEQTRPVGRPYHRSRDWRGAALLSAGLAMGAILGVGLALLFAPKSGAETRSLIAQKVRRRRNRDVWAELREELDEVGLKLARARSSQGEQNGEENL
jgi:hypothetical protein